MRWLAFRRLVTAIVKTAAVAVITLFGLTVFTFSIARYVPTDPVLAVVGDKASQATYDRVYKEMGLDKPMYVQFATYASRLATGDFGKSRFTQNQVFDDLKRVFPATFELATIGTLIGVLLGIPLGVLAAVRRGTWVDQLSRVIGLIGYSVPIFWLGLMGLLIFYAYLDWLPGPGRLDIAYQYTFESETGLVLFDAARTGQWDVFFDACRHILLPAALLGYFSMAYISRMTRSFMLNELSQEYITTARVKGLSEARIIWRHALRNAFVPLITVVALSYGSLLEGSVLTEMVFAWPGLGQYLTSSLMNTDMDAALGATLLVGIVFLFINLLSDVLYRVYDPRTR
jgi:peptide/nickel transport system permease protein